MNIYIGLLISFDILILVFSSTLVFWFVKVHRHTLFYKVIQEREKLFSGKLTRPFPTFKRIIARFRRTTYKIELFVLLVTFIAIFLVEKLGYFTYINIFFSADHNTVIDLLGKFIDISFVVIALILPLVILVIDFAHKDKVMEEYVDYLKPFRVILYNLIGFIVTFSLYFLTQLNHKYFDSFQNSLRIIISLYCIIFTLTFLLLLIYRVIQSMRRLPIYDYYRNLLWNILKQSIVDEANLRISRNILTNWCEENEISTMHFGSRDGARQIRSTKEIYISDVKLNNLLNLKKDITGYIPSSRGGKRAAIEENIPRLSVPGETLLWVPSDYSKEVKLSSIFIFKKYKKQIEAQHIMDRLRRLIVSKINEKDTYEFDLAMGVYLAIFEKYLKFTRKNNIVLPTEIALREGWFGQWNIIRKLEDQLRIILDEVISSNNTSMRQTLSLFLYRAVILAIKYKDIQLFSVLISLIWYFYALSSNYKNLAGMEKSLSLLDDIMDWQILSEVGKKWEIIQLEDIRFFDACITTVVETLKNIMKNSADNDDIEIFSKSINIMSELFVHHFRSHEILEQIRVLKQKENLEKQEKEKLEILEWVDGIGGKTLLRVREHIFYMQARIVNRYRMDIISYEKATLLLEKINTTLKDVAREAKEILVLDSLPKLINAYNATNYVNFGEWDETPDTKAGFSVDPSFLQSLIVSFQSLKLLHGGADPVNLPISENIKIHIGEIKGIVMSFADNKDKWAKLIGEGFDEKINEFLALCEKCKQDTELDEQMKLIETQIPTDVSEKIAASIEKERINESFTYRLLNKFKIYEDRTNQFIGRGTKLISCFSNNQQKSLFIGENVEDLGDFYERELSQKEQEVFVQILNSLIGIQVQPRQEGNFKDYLDDMIDKIGRGKTGFIIFIPYSWEQFRNIEKSKRYIPEYGLKDHKRLPHIIKGEYRGIPIVMVSGLEKKIILTKITDSLKAEQYAPQRNAIGKQVFVNVITHNDIYVDNFISANPEFINGRTREQIALWLKVKATIKIQMRYKFIKMENTKTWIMDLPQEE